MVPLLPALWYLACLFGFADCVTLIWFVLGLDVLFSLLLVRIWLFSLGFDIALNFWLCCADVRFGLVGLVCCLLVLQGVLNVMICVTYFVNSVGVLDSWCGLVLWFRVFELFLICYAVGLVAGCCCLLL